MRTEIIMPQMGESIVEGTVVNWLKKPGDKVERDEDLFEISTDKVESVIPSPVNGFLAEITVGAGQKVAVGTVLGYISESADDVSGDSSATSAAPAKEAAPVAAAPTTTTKTAAPAASASDDAAALRKTRSTPLVRRIAAEHNVDISLIKGTGLSGRVTKKDIMAFLANGGGATAQSAGTPVSFAPSLRHNAPEVPVGPNDRVEPMSVMRVGIAEHMLMSRQVSAHCQTVHECDVTKIEALRRKHKAAYAARGGKLSFTTFLVKAVADALRAFPIMNASVSGNNIVYHGDVNVGVAVAVESGLLVPNIKRSDEQSMMGLAKGVADLSERARTKKLTPDDVKHGTFAVSNSGIFGSLFGVPIISQPNVGILGVGGIKKRVMVDEDDNIAVRKMVYFCLTFDHRLIDGATADAFINKVKEGIENFSESQL